MKTIHIKLNDHEEELLYELTKKGGYRPSEALRMGLRLLHAKTLPAYVSRKNKVENNDIKGEKKEIIIHEETPEEVCIAQGGEVVIDDGVKKCKTMNGNLEVYSNL